MLRDSVSQRPFANTAKCRKSVITTRILQLVQELCIKRIHVTKRDLFYTDVKLFEVGGGMAPCKHESQLVYTYGWQLLILLLLPLQDQNNSDAVLDDVACLLGCTRSSLNGR